MKKIPEQNLTKRLPFKIATIYGAFSVAWILLSDKLLFYFVQDPEVMTNIQMLKGWIFVLTTALIIFYLLRRELIKYLKTEAAFHESEKKYKDLINNAIDLCYRADLEGNITFISPSVFKLFGYTVEEVTRENVSKFYANSDDRKVFLGKLQKNGFVEHFEVQLKRKDGSLFWGSTNASFYKDLSGNIIGVEGVSRDVTERKRAEEEKFEIEKQLRAIFNHRFQLTGLLGSDGKVLMINETACNMVGADGRELEGKYFWELPHWSHSEELQRKVRDAVHSAQNGNVIHFETTHPDSKGNIHFIDFTMTPVRDEKGEVIFIVPEGQDITEKKQSEKRLIESEKSYREIYNSGSDAILIHDAETGKIVDVNQTMLDMYGYAYQEVLQLDIEDISTDEQDFSQKQALKKVKKAIHEGQQLFEWAARRKDGSSFWVEVSLKNTTIGGKGRVLAVVRDITERKRLDTELRLVKHSIEYSAFPFEWIQKDGRFFYVNNASCRSLGYTHKELCSMHVHDIDPNFPIEDWPAFWEKLKSQKTMTFETRHRKKNGETFPVEITANHLEFEGREHVFANVRDISERKQYENDQKKLERQLQQAQKLESIGTLAGGIAHDFNNILSAILGNAELAKTFLTNGQDVTAELGGVIKAGLRARDLVKHILTFSRKSEVERQPIQLQQVIKETLGFVRSTMPSTIEVQSSLSPSDSKVVADTTQVHQILMNLCTNASHAMGDLPGKLSVTMDEVMIETEKIIQYKSITPGRYFRIAISDTGYGISQENIERIFDPFFTTKERGEGTGLGLSVVHGIIEGMGGSITVYSELGIGTTFNILLPIYEGAADEIQKTSSVMKRGKGHILVVDDEADIVFVVGQMLTGLGYQITTTTSSAEALERFQAEPNRFNLVLTDMTMPQMTGLDLSRKILDIRPETPIVICSGFSGTIMPKTAKEIGIRKILMKPLIMTELAETIAEVLQTEG